MSGLGPRRCRSRERRPGRPRASPPPPPPLQLLAPLLALVVVAAARCPCASALKACDVVIVVLSQTDSHHIDLAQQLKADIHQQALALSQDVPVVHLAHEEFSHPGAWTVIPILPKLRALHGDNSSWIFFCEEHTKINLPQVLHILEEHDPNEIMWVGHAIYDREATIIHHFAFLKILSTLSIQVFASGFAMTSTLLRRLSAQVLEYGASTDFSIDPAHELALFIWNNGKGPRITHIPHLCLQNNEDCASYPMPFTPCNDPISKKSIYFAVKTCEKFHHDRIPVIKKTWAKYVLNIGFYSEVTDNSIPTIDLGVPNTERGHCGKTFAILKHVALHVKKHPEIKWIVVVDDDTILSVTRLQQLLSCYDPKIMTAIGERYGYNVQHSDQGYNYITGGGGMVFSTNLIQAIVKSEQCQCPSNSTPDDMFLGICLSSLNVPITHSPLFHQARPSDYAPEYLTTQVPVSFHKHWMIDPLKVYKKWFAEADKQFEEVIQNKHVEL